MKSSKNEKRKIRHLRGRKKISGTPEKLRLAVFRSMKHIYASLVDDTVNPCRVMTAVSSQSKDFKSSAGDGAKGGNVKGAAAVGVLIAQKAKSLNVVQVVFDKGGFSYTGRIKALAEGARQGGLKF